MKTRSLTQTALTESSSPVDWIAQTKLLLPRLRSDMIPRPHLLNILSQAATNYPLTLVSAPAGYGKTTLLSQWTHRSGARDDTLSAAFPVAASARVAWLSISTLDNDPIHFLLAIIAALRSLHPLCGQTVLTLLNSSSYLDFAAPANWSQRLAGLLLNDILEFLLEPFVLVLDDYSRLTEPAVHATLNFLLEQLPSQMHLVLTCRQDPPLSLARLRAQGQLAELRLAKLAFTPDEMAIFFNDRLHLNLSQADLTNLYRQTDGWPAILRLLATSLAIIPGATDRTDFITHLTCGSTSLATHPHIFDYLAAEVLDLQEPVIRTFLLQTSILPELTPALCRAVTGRSDAPALLENLHRRGLFLAAITDQGVAERDRRPSSRADRPVAYRYHDLFANFLRHQLKYELPEQIADLHRRAAAVETAPDRKIAHYLAAEQWAAAADVIEQVGDSLVQQGLLDLLAAWIEALPASVPAERPRLLYLLGQCAWQQGRLAAGQELLERAFAAFAASGDETYQGQTLASLSLCLMLQNDYVRPSILIEQTLGYPLPPASRIQLMVSRIWLSMHQANWSQAEADLATVTTVAQAANDPSAWRALTYGFTPALFALTGGLACVETACRQALALPLPPDPFWEIILDYHLAMVHWFRGRLAPAAELADSVLARLEQFGPCHLPCQIDLLYMLALLHTVRRNYGLADRFFEQLFEQAPWPPQAEAIKVACLYGRARSYWQQGRLAEAGQLYQTLARYRDSDPLYAPLILPLAEGLLALAGRDYPTAQRRLLEAVALGPRLRHARLFGQPQLLLAYLYLVWNKPEQALAELTPLLAEVEQHNSPGFILPEGPALVPLLRLAVRRGVHAAFAARLLDLLGATDISRPFPLPDSAQILTPREVEVLVMIAAGLANQAIADQLVVTLKTVKNHINSLMGKLKVTSRAETIGRARQLGLL